MNAPEIINQNIEDTQQCNEEHSRIFCFESNCNHDTCEKSDCTDCNTTCTPAISSENEAEEEEDEKDSTCELKVGPVCRRGIGEFWKSCECDLTTVQRVGKNHQKSTDHAQVSVVRDVQLRCHRKKKLRSKTRPYPKA